MVSSDNPFAQLWRSGAVFSIESAAIRSPTGEPAAVAASGSGPNAQQSSGLGANATAQLYAVTSTGQSVALDSAVVFGRNPSGEVRRVVFASDVVSSNHLRLEMIDGGLMATDLNSTNGTVLMRKGYPDFSLPANQGIPVYKGDELILDNGEDNGVVMSITIE